MHKAVHVLAWAVLVCHGRRVQSPVEHVHIRKGTQRVGWTSVHAMTGITPLTSEVSTIAEAYQEERQRHKTSFVTKAVQSVGPAVVKIVTEYDNPSMPDGYFFPVPEGIQRGQGSGMIWSDDGTIVTNAHVVKGATKVTISLPDGRSFEGSVLGCDDYLDLAAIKIELDGGELPTVPRGHSDQLEVGDWVIAIGNPGGLDSTVTLGIVSSLSRSAADVGIPNKKMSFIQTDAAINPGNSGGPLLNEFGEVIGINTAKRDNFAGVGFAIPIDMVERAVAELSQGHRIAHPYLGIQLTSLTVELARKHNKDPDRTFDLPEMAGALVVAIFPDTPAFDAGMRPYDLILDVDSRSIQTAADLQDIINNSEVGQRLRMKVVRNRQVRELVVTLADLSAKEKD